MNDHTLLQQDHTCEPIVQVPEVHTADAALIIELTVNIERLVRSHFKLAHTLTGHSAVLQGRVEFIAPWRTVAVPVTVVVTEQIVAAGLRAAADLQGLVNGGEEVFGQIWHNCRDRMEIGLGIAGVQAPKQIAESNLVSLRTFGTVEAGFQERNCIDTRMCSLVPPEKECDMLRNTRGL